MAAGPRRLGLGLAVLRGQIGTRCLSIDESHVVVVTMCGNTHTVSAASPCYSGFDLPVLVDVIVRDNA
jgi:hypothetical protein